MAEAASGVRVDGRQVIARRLLLGCVALIGVYFVSYAALRCTRVLVRREWFEMADLGNHSYRIHEGTDVGQGGWWDDRSQGFLTRFYLPLWHAELRLRGCYYDHVAISDESK